MNQVLTPFSYAFAETGEVLDAGENVVIETVEDTQTEDVQELDTQDSSANASEWQEDTQEPLSPAEQSSPSLTGQDSPSREQNTPLTGSEISPLTGGVSQSDEGVMTGNTQDSQQAEQAQQSWVNFGDAQNDGNGTGDINDEVDYSQYTSETRVAVLANKLWINWEEDAKYYAELAWIREEYRWTTQQNEQIRLFLLDNLKGILNGEFEERITEMKESSENTQDSQQSWVNFGDVSEWLTWTWDVSSWTEWNESEGSYVWNGTGNTQDSSADASEWLTGSVLTGDIELLTGEVLTWEVFTWSAIDAVNETLEEIAAQRAEELAHIWDELNETKIIWQDMYKDVIVSVEAPVNSFPAATELRITPITGNTQVQEIRDQLVENTDVTQESELVSFDISFIYTLSNGEEIELQPYTWQTVKVSFNYTYNDVLVEANDDDSKELKVYHLEEVRDDEGKKTNEVEVKEVEINKSESIDWELVVDAEKFSVYTIVTQQFEEPQTTSTWRLWVDYNEIVTQNWSNCITIMDRNLWATTTWAWASAPTTSYGYYYQWWNNYWFTTDTAQANNTSVKPDDLIMVIVIIIVNSLSHDQMVNGWIHGMVICGDDETMQKVIHGEIE